MNYIASQFEKLSCNEVFREFEFSYILLEVKGLISLYVIGSYALKTRNRGLKPQDQGVYEI